MKPQIIGIDTQSVLGLASRGRGRDAKNQNLFESLLTQLTSSRTGQVAAAQTAQSQPAPAAANADPLPADQTPLAMLQQGMSDKGLSAERMQIPASDRSRLEEVLVACGYKAEDAKQILDKSANSDGSINLGTVFGLLSQYTPQQGPQFFLKSVDKPLLSQVLKGLGIPDEDVNSFMEGLETVGEKVRVTGLPSLLAKAGSKTGDKAGQVDRAALADLLGKMGLSSDEVNTLLAKAYDGQDRANPKAVLALLQAAANRQDQATAESLKELANRIKVVPQGQQKPLDADRLRAQFIKAVEEVNAGLTAKSGEFSKDLTQALSALAKGQGEGKLTDLLGRSVKGEGAAQSGEGGQAQSQAAAARAAESPASGNQAGLAGGNGRQGGEGQSASASRAAQPNSAFGAAMGRAEAAGESGTAGGPRSVLPAHVVRQVGLAMVQMAAKEQTTLRLELKPPSLGELNLELAVKDGTVTAKMVAESAAAKQALEAGLDQLKQDLANQGLKVARIEITVNPDAERGQTQAQNQGEGRGNGEAGSRWGGQDYTGVNGEREEEQGLGHILGRAAGARISVFA